MSVETVTGKSARPTLTFTTVEIAGIPHGQQANPMITFDQANFDADPVSGNQDEEFLKLDNPNDVAVDISGWRAAG